MNLKIFYCDTNWHLGPKKNTLSYPPGPIFDIPVNPVPHYIATDCGDKVQDLETTEKTVQLLLRRKHLYLTKVKNIYKLKKIIFHTQIVRNWNIKNGYPENRNLGPRPMKYSTQNYPVPTSVAKAPQSETVIPPVVPPHTTIPKTWPRIFFTGVPRPIKYPPFHPEETDCSGEVPTPEYIITPFSVEVPPPEIAEDPETEFVQIDSPDLIKYSSFFDV